VRLAWLFRSPACLVGIMAVGAVLRVWQYFGNPSFELDELALARNIVERPLWKLLLTPLLFDQVAPQGFLLSEKGIVLVLGDTEYALRLGPLVCSFVSLVLFWRISLEVLRGLAAPFAVALFALRPTFVLYGATLKQYSSDIAAVLLLTLLALKLRPHYATWPQYLLIGAIGLLVVQWSQAAVLTLLGLGCALMLLALAKQKTSTLRALSITLALWAVGAVSAVVMGVQSLTAATHTYMQLYWREGFMPWQSSSYGKNVAIWLWTRFYEVFDLEKLHSAWYEWPGLYVGLAVFGIWSLWHRRRDACLIILGPIMITLVAAVAHQYPFKGRPGMFLAPLFLMAAAEGAEWLRRLWSSRLPTIGAMGMILLAVLPLYDFATHLPVYRREETKPIFAYVQARRLLGDAIYVYYGAWQAMSFYATRYGFREGEYVIGDCHRGNRLAYLRELDSFRGRPRVWVLIAHAIPSLQELPTIISYLDRIGIRRESIVIPARIWDKTPGAHDAADAHAYLYDLSDETRLALASAETFALASPTKIASHSTFSCHAGPHVPVASDVPR
jgi:hypothetical protein